MHITFRDIENYRIESSSMMQVPRITMCTRICRQVASVTEDKPEKLLPGHIRTT